MNDITLLVTENKLEIIKDTYTTGGSVDYDTCTFNFDTVWKYFYKTAVFMRESSDAYRVELVDNSCKIPAECMRTEGILKIGLYGVNEDGVVITTNFVTHRIHEGVGEAGLWVEEDSAYND
ncbi:MAG: hypothetical protein IKJ69_04365 [Clostridia bacterium]|nr:hypothetical protein [Clostridia bacterium]